MTASELCLHGHRIAYRTAGSGPVLLLIHGIAGSSATWDDVLPWLAERYCVVAPDLLGHGGSAKPRGDYSLGAYASGIRDLLGALGHERASVVGHSLGGGVAMQFAYQFPERCERLVLVDSGGLGRDVSLLLRAATLPGSELVLPIIASQRLHGVAGGMAQTLGRVGLRLGSDLAEMARGYGSLADAGARQAFIHTLRAVIDITGQRVSATDRLYLLESMPTLIVWGERDHTIPLAHGRAAHDAIPGSRFETLPRAAHFPHLEDPEGLATVLRDFLETTEPRWIEDADWGQVIASRSTRTRRDVPSAPLS